jgi:hypothetical protein
MAASSATSVERREDDGRRVLQLLQSDMRPWLSRQLDTAAIEAKKMKDANKPVEVVPVDEHTEQKGLNRINKNAKSSSAIRMFAQVHAVDKSILAFRELAVYQERAKVLAKADFEDVFSQAVVQMNDKTSVARFLGEPCPQLIVKVEL